MEQDTLMGKRVLFICHKFYDYHEKITKQLNLMGAKVIFFENRLFREDPVLYPNNLISKSMRLLNPGYKKNYLDHILDQTKDDNFDFLFCVGGFSVTADFVDKIKERNKNLQTVIYFWDSFKVWPFQHLLKSFDRVYSFDRSDCEQYNLIYLPLFYSEKKNNPSLAYNDRDIDLLYVGSVGPISKNRFRLLAAFNDFSKRNQLKSFLYLFFAQPKHNFFVKKLNAVRSLFDSQYRSFNNDIVYFKEVYGFVHYKSLNSSELNGLLSRAKVVIDIAVPGQIGLTMRTIESLHMGCKLITTNPAITKEKFFDDEWVKVIELDELKIDISFLKNKPSSAIDIQYLSIENWLQTIIKN